MSTSTTDVNTQFDTQRADQYQSAVDAAARMTEREAVRKADWDQRVRDGKLLPLGNGKFRVSEPGSWDDGEVFTEQLTTLDGVEMVVAMPDHGLAVKDGKVSLYTRLPEWHSVGNVIPEGTSDVPAVLRAGGIDWETAKVPALYRRHGKVLTDPRAFHHVRTDSDYSLAVVGKTYQPFQNAKAADFLHEVVADHGIVFETAGELRDGETVFISLRMPENLVVDPGGVSDEIVQYLMWSNNHAAKGKAKIVMTPWRPRCGNTHGFGLRDAARSYGISHTGNLDQKVEMARKALGISVSYFGKLAEEETRLARTDVSFADFDALVKEIWPEKDEPTRRESGISDRRRDTLRGLFAGYSAELGQTAYALENTMTDFLDHVAPRRALNDSMAAARATALIEDDDLKAKTAVHRQLLTLSNR